MKGKMNLLWIAIIALFVVGMCSCDKDEDTSVKTIENLSGYAWYKTTVFVAETKDGDYTIVSDGMPTVGIGQNIRVKTNAPYFSISARTSTGQLLMTGRIEFSGNRGTVTLKDLY